MDETCPEPDPGRDTGDPRSVSASTYRILRAGDLDISGDPERSRLRLTEAILDRPEHVDGDDATALHGEPARRFILGLLDRHGAALADRSTIPAHLTGSALVIDPTTRRVILMLHAKLGRWLQPGGHADGDHELAGVALREATEETGIDELSVVVPAIDLDVHLIPSRGAEPEHLHLDLRFVVLAPPGARPVSNHESHDLRWVPAADVASLTEESGLLRLVARGISALDCFSSDQPEWHRNPSD